MERAWKKLKEEEGNIIVLFAGTLLLLCFFVGIAFDLSLYYTRKNDLENLCRLLREDRFTHQDSIRYADNPGAKNYIIASKTLQDNGFAGDLSVFFKEESFPAQANSRQYKIRIELSENFDFHFLKIFGLSNVRVKAYIDGKENYGEGGSDVIWHPSAAAETYSGVYSGSAGSGYSFTQGTFPSGW
ncbi:MAG: hypothetical protein Q4A19_06880 [Johnsonella sp.]|nr:hypothetical protein [Johnsonella sp.]